MGAKDLIRNLRVYSNKTDKEIRLYMMVEGKLSEKEVNELMKAPCKIPNDMQLVEEFDMTMEEIASIIAEEWEYYSFYRPMYREFSTWLIDNGFDC